MLTLESQPLLIVVTSSIMAGLGVHLGYQWWKNHNNFFVSFLLCIFFAFLGCMGAMYWKVGVAILGVAFLIWLWRVTNGCGTSEELDDNLQLFSDRIV